MSARLKRAITNLERKHRLIADSLLDAYVEKNTEAEVTHTVCPDCIQIYAKL